LSSTLISTDFQVESSMTEDGMKRLNHPFKIIAFDWDGTAVENRAADATMVTMRLEYLMQQGVQIVVITGTNFKNVDRQFSSTIKGPHKQNLFICTNRGSEVFGFDQDSNQIPLHIRAASTEENNQLTRIAERVRDEIQRRSGVKIEIVYDRVNRRKIDLIPEPEWVDPPKSQIGDLLVATENRLKSHGWNGGIREAIDLTKQISSEEGLRDARITTDVKHIEVGLTDKSDSVSWVMNELARKKNVPSNDVLFAGDEFGPIAGFEGSDFKMVTPEARNAVYVSVGPEPNGVPENVIHLAGGPARFIHLLETQIKLMREVLQEAREK